MHLDLKKEELYISDSEMYQFALDNKLAQNLVPEEIANCMIYKQDNMLRVKEELPRTGDSQRFKIYQKYSNSDPNFISKLSDDSSEKSDSLESARQLLNYTAKQLEKFSLTSIEFSLTINDIKYDIKVTK